MKKKTCCKKTRAQPSRPGCWPQSRRLGSRLPTTGRGRRDTWRSLCSETCSWDRCRWFARNTTRRPERKFSHLALVEKLYKQRYLIAESLIRFVGQSRTGRKFRLKQLFKFRIDLQITRGLSNEVKFHLKSAGAFKDKQLCLQRRLHPPDVYDSEHSVGLLHFDEDALEEGGRFRAEWNLWGLPVAESEIGPQTSGHLKNAHLRWVS